MNKIQTLIAELIKESSFNNFDGQECVDALLECKEMWKAFMWGRFEHNELITLRDIDTNSFNADTLYLLVVPGKEEQLENFIRLNLDPDELEWEPKDKAGKLLGSWPQTERSLLRCWWD